MSPVAAKQLSEQTTFAVGRSIVVDYSWGNHKRLVDMGGCYGSFLKALLLHWPKTRGVVFDQPHVRIRLAWGLAAVCSIALHPRSLTSQSADCYPRLVLFRLSSYWNVWEWRGGADSSIWQLLLDAQECFSCYSFICHHAMKSH